MKLNIFARLNNIEDALANKEESPLSHLDAEFRKRDLEVHFLKKELADLRKVIEFQGSVILRMKTVLNLRKPNLTSPAESTEKPVEKPVESIEERAKRSKREWYERNKKAITERRKIANKIKEAAGENSKGKVYYWKNRDKMLEYGREYYRKKKAGLTTQKQQELL